MTDQEDSSLRPAVKLQLASMQELTRMAFFTARERVLNFLLFESKETKKWYIGFVTGLIGYYQFRGVPMFFYVELDKKPEVHSFIRYTSKEKEQWSFSAVFDESHKFGYLPVVLLAEQPIFF